MNRDVIIACDFASQEELFEFLAKFDDVHPKPFLKVGMELFYAAGPQIVKEIKARGHKIFLDLKLHDIPQTVKKTMRVLSELDVDLTNLHCAGGIEMMRAALAGLTRADGTRPLLIGVTQLTSTSQETLEQELLIARPIAEVVREYASNAQKAGLDGVVCSPLEAATVHADLGAKFLTVTPGIRFPDAAADDQHRVTTPAQAHDLGADFIVVGRPITQATDPVAAYKRCVTEFC
ncbi:orotidine-5'-phosphate decarboxylase [Arcanobacterium hippocoleae]|uniref:orotidine-5'-phosphate decarboxylase n=1 Tax=Arcanobacterium hippocoleae TaxID=149017 RepID=UPI00333FF889